MIATVGTIFNVLDGALNLINKSEVDDVIKKGKLGLETRGSITKLIAETVIAPRIIISESLKTNADIDKIVNLNTDIIVGMLSRAFLLLTRLKGFEPNAAFDVLKTDKKTFGGLESFGIANVENIAKQMYSSKGLTLGKNITVRLEDDEKKKDYNQTTGLYSKDIDLKLEVKNDKGEIKVIEIPIIIKSHISYNSLIQIKTSLIDKKFEKDLGERILEAKAGIIPWLNVVIPFDMWAEYEKKKINDTEELLAYAEERGRTSISKLATSGMPGLSSYLGALVISFDDLEDIENNVLRGKITSSSKLELLFNNSHTSLLNIVDTDYNKLTIHTKDIEGQSIFDLKSLKKNSNGNDISDLFKDILMNKRF